MFGIYIFDCLSFPIVTLPDLTIQLNILWNMEEAFSWISISFQDDENLNTSVNDDSSPADYEYSLRVENIRLKSRLEQASFCIEYIGSSQKVLAKWHTHVPTYITLCPFSSQPHPHHDIP